MYKTLFIEVRQPERPIKMDSIVGLSPITRKGKILYGFVEVTSMEDALEKPGTLACRHNDEELYKFLNKHKSK